MAPSVEVVVALEAALRMWAMEGMRIPMSTAIMATTTSNSMSVNAWRRGLEIIMGEGMSDPLIAADYDDVVVGGGERFAAIEAVDAGTNEDVGTANRASGLHDIGHDRRTVGAHRGGVLGTHAA